MTRQLTGWHALAIFVGCFGVIIAVNLTLAFNAVATFPGLEVKNSYVASQTFDRDRTAQEALGWEVTPVLTPGTLTLRITDAEGHSVVPTQISAILGRSTIAAQDMEPVFHRAGDTFTAPVAATPGRWTLRLKMTAGDGTRWQRLFPLIMPDAGA